MRVGLDGPVNVFRFEVGAAEDALLAHPWVATAEINKSLPGQVTIRYEERKPEGVVVLGALYLVDGTGEPFAQPTPAEAAGLPEVELYDRRTDPGESKNLAAQRPDIVNRQLAEIRQWIQAQQQIARHLGAAGKSTLDSKTLDRLRSLGYIGGAPKQ